MLPKRQAIIGHIADMLDNFEETSMHTSFLIFLHDTLDDSIPLRAVQCNKIPAQRTTADQCLIALEARASSLHSNIILLYSPFLRT